MKKKKIFWIIILVIFLIAIIGGLVFFSNKKDNSPIANSSVMEINSVHTGDTEEENKTLNEYIKVELSDGILYSTDGKKHEADMTIGDNYFDTTITDMYMNPEDYYGMNIEVQGMYLTDGKYTSVGRYSTSNLCAYCPAGYSFIEYQLDGTIDKELETEKDWIKIIGTLQKGNDETSAYQDYFYLKATNIEIMNEKGNDTVNN